MIINPTFTGVVNRGNSIINNINPVATNNNSNIPSPSHKISVKPGLLELVNKLNQ